MHTPVEVSRQEKFIRAPFIHQAVSDISKDVRGYWQNYQAQEHKSAKPLLAVAIMNGAMYFAPDLLRQLWYHGVKTEFDSITVSRYGANIEPGEAVITGNNKIDPAGYDVALIDTIFNEGTTFIKAQEFFKERGAASVFAVSLIQQLSEGQPEQQFDFPLVSVGFIERFGRWYAGYGIDYKQQLRQQPFLVMGSKEEFAQKYPELQKEIAETS